MVECGIKARHGDPERYDKKGTKSLFPVQTVLSSYRVRMIGFGNILPIAGKRRGRAC
jgi:hypothetical protein